MTRDSHFDHYGDHTRLKHFLVDNYLKQWATILIRGMRLRGKPGPRLWVVDAFAGEGRDSYGVDGSPIIAAKIAKAINDEHFAVPLAASEGMRVIAIEAHRRRYERLVSNLAPYMAAPAIAFAHHGRMQDVLDGVLQQIGADPTFVFLDPFGLDGLDADMLPRLLNGPRSELLVLLSDEGAVRLHGKAEATVPSPSQLLATRPRAPSVFGSDFDQEQAAADRVSIEHVLAGHASNPHAELILNRAFGGLHWKAIISATHPDERRQKFVDLYSKLLAQSGASHLLQFAVTTGAGRHKYTLLHASKHERAFAAMKEAMYRARKWRVVDEQQPSLFSDDDSPTLTSRANVHDVALATARHFSGQQVRWSGDYSATTVRAYARDKTPLLIHEFEALKQELIQAGYARVTTRVPLTLTFANIAS